MVRGDRCELGILFATHSSQQAIRLVPDSKFKVRWPILNRRLNTRDWKSRQTLIDDIALILHESLRTELGVKAADYKVSFSAHALKANVRISLSY